MNFLVILMILISTAFAGDIDKRPNPFAYGNSQGVFADFTQSTYYITYDITQKKAFVTAIIQLTTVEEGHVIFDLQADPYNIIDDDDGHDADGLLRLRGFRDALSDGCSDSIRPRRGHADDALHHPDHLQHRGEDPVQARQQMICVPFLVRSWESLALNSPTSGRLIVSSSTKDTKGH